MIDERKNINVNLNTNPYENLLSKHKVSTKL